MNFTRSITLLFAVWLAGGWGLAAAPAAPTVTRERNDKTLRAGQELARQLLAQRPRESSQVRGTIKIRAKKSPTREIPFNLEIIVGANSWKSVYETEATPGQPAVRLVITHTVGRATEFSLQSADSRGVFDEPKTLAWKEALKPFAGSDFRILDLAYPHSDFLAWPEQYILQTAIRRGQSCYELESVNPNPGNGGFAKVVSWIDIDSGGPVYIYGYDRQGNESLKFSPQGIKSVGGEYRVTELVISRRKTGSRTTLKFDFDTE